MNPFDIEKLEQVGKRENMNLGNTEKDYVLSVVLSELSKLRISRQLVFKGGTALKKAYFPKYRFSSDLDFTAINLKKESVKKDIDEVFRNKNHEGVEFKDVSDESHKKGNSLNLFLKYESQVSKRSGKTFTDSIKIDINFDNTIILSAVERQLVFPAEYGLQATFRAMALEDIVAEKVHAIYSRAKPRDLYDLWFLLTSGVEFNEKLINEKLKKLETDEEGKPSFDTNVLKQRIGKLNSTWEADIGVLLNVFPSFSKVELDVLVSIRVPPVNKKLVMLWTGQIKKALKIGNTENLRVVITQIAQASNEQKVLNQPELKEALQSLFNPSFNDAETILFLLATYVNQTVFFRNLVAESAKQVFGDLSHFLSGKFPPPLKINACKLLLTSDTPEALERFITYIKEAEKEEWSHVEGGVRDFTTASSETKEKLYGMLLDYAGGTSNIGKRAESLLHILRSFIQREQ